MFTPAHDAVVLYALEDEDSIQESDGLTPSTLLPLDSPLSVLGYTQLPQTARGLNNSKGFAIGQQGASYNKRGRIEPTATVEIRPGSVEALEHLLPTSDGSLRSLAICIVVKGNDADSTYTDVYRHCKPSTLDWKFSGGGDKGGGEISVSAEFWALAYQRVDSLLMSRTDWRDQLRTLGTPLMWHDVRQFTIGSTSYRRSLMDLSVKVDYGLERKNERPNWGDNYPLSRTAYALLEHHVNVSGEVALHERLPKELFHTAITSQDWEDISINCFTPNTTGRKGFALTLQNVFPSDETLGGGESSAEIDHTVPFTADNIALTAPQTT